MSLVILIADSPSIFHYILIALCAALTLATAGYFYMRFRDAKKYSTFGLIVLAVVSILFSSFGLDFYELTKGSSGQKIPFLIMVALNLLVIFGNGLYGPKRPPKKK